MSKKSELYNIKQSNNIQHTLFGLNTTSNDDDSFISRFIHNKEIYIDKINWKNLNAKYTPNEIIDEIIKNIQLGKIDFPYNKISLNECISLFKKFCDYKPNSIKYGQTYSRFNDYKYELSNKYLQEANTFNGCSDYFQRENRMKVSGARRSLSPFDTFYSEKAFRNTLHALWTLKMDSVTNRNLLHCIAMRDYVASQFNPSIAKSIYTIFDSKNILDFSAGWGDRLCGAYATKGVQSYTGIDPNTLVYDSYYKQIELYETLTDKKHIELYNLPAEDVTSLEDNSYDTVFTSPPYFNTELYSLEDTQSCNRYQQLDLWLEKFLFTVLEKCYRALKPNGYMIINISDLWEGSYKINRISICDRMNDFIKELGMTYVDGLGMRLSVMPGITNDSKLDNNIFIEPMWVWRKL